MAQVHLITGPERRRRWSEEAKRALVAAAFAPGAVVQAVARRADVHPNQIYRWRQELHAAPAGFAEVRMVPGASGVSDSAMPAIEVEFADRARVRIAASTPPGLAATVIKALRR